MPSDWVALVAWGLLLIVLVSAAVAIGRLTARLFLRASATHRR